jgi:hypothetical protein
MKKYGIFVHPGKELTTPRLGMVYETYIPFYSFLIREIEAIKKIICHNSVISPATNLFPDDI